MILLKKLPTEKPKMQFWTLTEFLHFQKIFESEEYHIKLLFTVLFFTGLRLGEALALTWQDIDFSSNTIHVTKSIYINKGISHISTAKTKAGTRRIIINRKLSQELQNWRKQQEHLLEQFTTDSISLQVFQSIPITTTIDTYSHLYPSKQRDLADKLDDLL